MKIDIAQIRQEYTRAGLKRCEVPMGPFELFDTWLQEAIDSGLPEPTAMAVATVGPDGQPSMRTVLLKELREGQFVFFSNYHSRKGRQLAANPHIALSFFWYALERQVHIEGIASRLAPEESDAYFASRPFGSRIGALASPQSETIPNRADLLRRFVSLKNRYEGKEVPRPEHWGGYAVVPSRIEFWQGRENRLHDRILYTPAADGQWKTVRLAP